MIRGNKDELRPWREGQEDASALAEQGIEVWVPAQPAPSRYQVSNLGRVWSEVRRGYLAPYRQGSGYVSVTLFFGGGAENKKTWLLHRLVAVSFLGFPENTEKTDVRHVRSPDKADNRLCNLGWGTRSRNMKDVWEHRLQGLGSCTSSAPDPTPNPTYGLDGALVQRGIQLFQQGQITLQGLSILWEVSPDVARRALVGETWTHLLRDQAALAHHLGRHGHRHHKAEVSDEAHAEALKLYVEQHWSGVQFADFLGVKQITAHMFLSGKRRKHIPRPEGFQYPWPDAASMNRRVGGRHGCATITEEQVVDLLERVTAGEFSSVKEIQETFSISRGIAYGLLGGQGWPHVPRPEGMKEAASKFQRTTRTPEERASILAHILSGAPRSETKEKFKLTTSQLAPYVTKAKKQAVAL